MALSDLLNLSNRSKIGLSEERVMKMIPVARQYISFFREYPDIFIDFCAGNWLPEPPKETLKLYFFQRIFLRAAMRYKYNYVVYPRAYSKSFLAVLILMTRAILYPGAKLFVTSGGKEQSSGILKEKVEEICQLVPGFAHEIDRSRGKSVEGKDYCKYIFRNKSYIDNLSASEKSRGKRRHGGLMEECVGIDGTILNEVIIPVMNISRRLPNNTTIDEEVLNKSQIYVTTAGWKGSFAYDKLIQFLIGEVTQPEKYNIMGGTYLVPVLAGLQDKNFIRDLKLDGTFNQSSFDREYRSIWSGTIEDAFFSSEMFDKNRILRQPEYSYSGRSLKSAQYILSVDVGRKGCQSVICVFKVTPQQMGTSIKTLVNMATLNDEHFEDQAIKLKRMFYEYRASRIVIDGNGLGIGLIDYMIKTQIDPDTNETLYDFGIYNDDEGYYKKYQTINCEYDAIYIIKANAPINTEAHANVQTQLSSGKVKFLIDERTAQIKLLGTEKGKKMSAEERANYLYPFTLTSILKEEMLNLREENEGQNIILKQANRGIRKDKFSALEYGLYYIKQEEDNKKRKKHGRFSDFMFLN